MVGAIGRLVKIIWHFNRVLAVIGAVFASFLMCEIFYCTMMRYVFTKPVMWTQDVAWMMFGPLIAFPLGYVLLTRGHIPVTLVYSRLRPSVRRYVDIVNTLLVLAVATFLLLGTWNRIWEALRMGFVTETMEINYSFLYAPMSLGFAGLVLAALVDLGTAISRLRRKADHD